MEEGLRETADRLRAILDSAVDGIVVIDARGKIESVNPAAVEIFGYAEDELLGNNVRMLMPSPYREEHDEYLEQYLESRRPRVIGIGREVVGLRKDGTELPLYLAVSEGTHRNQPIFTGIVRNLTDLRAAEERARSAEQLASLSVITAGIAHDVGTPMNVILGYAELLSDSLEDSKNKRRAQLIAAEVRRVTDLLQTLLNIARPREAIRAPVDLESVLGHGLEFFREKLRMRGIRVARDFEVVPRILGDRDRLEQLFLNLYVNAADAMPEGGILSVGLRAPSEALLEVEIRDTGLGIEPDRVGRIFEPFYSSKERGKGTGLGLVVSRSIVLDHDGTIEVESELDKGTCFTIRFPVAGAQIAS